jgi:putative transposase
VVDPYGFTKIFVLGMTYRRKNSLRGKGFDFTQPGFYFVTICVQNNLKIFGEIKNGKMILSEAGKIVEQMWFTIPDHYTFTKLHTRQVMPDHFHGIVELVYGKPEPTSISVMMNHFKGAVTKQVKASGLDIKHPIWQRSFNCNVFWMHDDFARIEKYIIDNPKNYLTKKSEANSLV